jgi:hypothetical protein
LSALQTFIAAGALPVGYGLTFFQHEHPNAGPAFYKLYSGEYAGWTGTYYDNIISVIHVFIPFL